MATQVRTIIVKVDDKGSKELKNISDSMGGFNKKLKSASDSLNMFKNIAIGVFAGFGIREIAGISDSMQQLGDRIGILTGDAGGAGAVIKELEVRAGRTKTSVDNLATTFSRFAVSAKEAGLSTSQLLDLTEMIQNTFRLSGASVDEAAGASVQLSQAFARGQLRGQELISVLSQNAYMANILSKSFGVTRGELLKMAEQGRITSDKVLTALFENMSNTNKEAEKLGQTFDQTLTVSMNKVKVAIYELNKEFDLSGKFAKGVEFISRNIEILGGLLAALAITQIPRVISSIEALAIAMRAFALSNPIVAALTAATIALTAFYAESKKMEEANTFSSIDDAVEKLGKLSETYNKLTAVAEDYKKKGQMFDFRHAMEIADQMGEKIEKARKYIIQNTMAQYQEGIEKKKQIDATLDSMKKSGGIGERSDALKKLNAEYDKHLITSDQYYKALLNIDRLDIKKQWTEGKIDLAKYNDEMLKIKQTELHLSFASGKTSLEEFNQAMRASEIEALDNKFKHGTMTLQNYKKELLDIKSKYSTGFWEGMRTGVDVYLESMDDIGKSAQNLSGTVFKGLEDGLVEFLQNWNQDWKQIGQTVLNEINRMIIRLYLIKPVLEGIFGPSLGGAATVTPSSNTGGGYLGATTTFAQGGAFYGNTRYFASGGIVDSPTAFSYGQGNLGVMGEAGPEAIMPLSRTSDGSMGVSVKQAPVVVNIVNQTGADIQQQETQGPNGERVLEVMITNKVREGIAKGSFDKTFAQNFGLARRGV